MATLKPEQVAARKGVAQALVQLAKGAEGIMQERPPVGDTPEQAAEKIIQARRDETMRKLFEKVEQAEAERSEAA